MNTLKLHTSKIILVFVLLFTGCSDRSTFTDPNDPGMGGVFTTIGGEISGILTEEKSPYYISENLIIPANASLTIEPGVLLFFNINTGLYIFGGIRAIGTSQQPISFQGFGNAWEGIHSENPTDSLIYIFSEIEEVYLPIASDIRYGGLDVTNANLILKNCYFYFNYARNGGALSIAYSNSEIINNIFYDNECLEYGGAILSQNCSNKIINNTFVSNFCLNFGGAITLVDPVSEDIQNNIFYNNFSYRGNPTIHIVLGDSANVSEHYNYLDPDSLNPSFISSTDFHLQSDSPCKNAGNPSPEFNNVDGSRNDKGSYGGPGGGW